MIAYSEELRRPRVRSRLGFTLVEMQIALGIFSLVVIGMVYLNLFGLKQDELVLSKLGASDQSRLALAGLSKEIRTAKAFRVGTGSQSSFTPTPNGDGQIGNAVEIYESADMSHYIRYFIDTNAGELYRLATDDTSPRLVAQFLTNSTFEAENYLGELQYDLTKKNVLHVTLEFRQFQYPLTKVGPEYYYNRYKIEYRLTTHAPL